MNQMTMLTIILYEQILLLKITEIKMNFLSYGNFYFGTNQTNDDLSIYNLIKVEGTSCFNLHRNVVRKCRLSQSISVIFQFIE
jgi:hypothetical protein